MNKWKWLGVALIGAAISLYANKKVLEAVEKELEGK